MFTFFSLAQSKLLQNNINLLLVSLLLLRVFWIAAGKYDKGLASFNSAVACQIFGLQQWHSSCLSADLEIKHWWFYSVYSFETFFTKFSKSLDSAEADKDLEGVNIFTNNSEQISRLTVIWFIHISGLELSITLHFDILIFLYDEYLRECNEINPSTRNITRKWSCWVLNWMNVDRQMVSFNIWVCLRGIM